MPKQDWVSLFNTVCAALPPGCSCEISDSYYLLKGVENNKGKFGPIRAQIDNVIYEIPFDRFWIPFSSNTWILQNNDKEMIVFGIRFLDQYYQVFDMKRNQMAIAPSVYSQMGSPIVKVRDHVEVIMPSSVVTLIAFVFLIANRKIASLSSDDDKALSQREKERIFLNEALNSTNSSQKQDGKADGLLNMSSEKFPQTDVLEPFITQGNNDHHYASPTEDDEQKRLL